MDKYDYYNRRTRNVLVHECGWSRDNETGAWRSERPEIDHDKCNSCALCWLYCPEAAISRRQGKIVIDEKYCKGCGICAVECKRKAIKMVKEDDQ